MRTQAIQDPVDLNVRLTHYSAEGGEIEEHPLESFPFIVGRSETCDLCIDSGRVSREHAVFTFDQGVFRIRDLGSTNGTYVNGRLIDDAAIHDGDVIVFADIEFAFSTGQAAGRGSMATQVIDPHKTDDSISRPCRAKPSSEVWVDQLRQTHEMLTRRAVRPRLRPLVAPADGALVGREAIAGDEDPRAAALRPLQFDEESRVAGSLRHLARMIAVEEAIARDDSSFVLLHLAAAEIGCDGLYDSLMAIRLASTADSIGRCVIAIPDVAISDTAYVVDLHGWLRRVGFRILHDGFAGAASQLAHRRPLAPDFIKLPPPLTRGIDLNPRRQEHVASLVSAAEAFGAKIAVSELVAAGEWAVCRQLPIAFVQGPASDAACGSDTAADAQAH